MKLRSLVHIVIYGAAILVVRLFTRPGRGVLASAGLTEWPFKVADSAFYLGAVLLTTALACRWLNQKPLKSLGLETNASGAKSGLGGMAIGAISMSFIFFIALALGWVRVLGVQTDGIFTNMTVALALQTALAVNEEVIFRGYIYQRLMTGFGANTATLASAILFALVHTTNPNASLGSVLPLALSGLLLVAQYRVTRSLWMPIGFHFTWNLLEGPIYGFPLSGVDDFSLLKISTQGPAEFVGDEFGPEGALLGVLATLIGFGLLWLWSKQTATSSMTKSISVREEVV